MICMFRYITLLCFISCGSSSLNIRRVQNCPIITMLNTRFGQGFLPAAAITNRFLSCALLTLFFHQDLANVYIWSIWPSNSHRAFLWYSTFTILRFPHKGFPISQLPISLCCLSDLLSLHGSFTRLMSVWRATFWGLSQTSNCLGCLSLNSLEPLFYYLEDRFFFHVDVCGSVQLLGNIIKANYVYVLDTQLSWSSITGTLLSWETISSNDEFCEQLT